MTGIEVTMFDVVYQIPQSLLYIMNATGFSSAMGWVGAIGVIVGRMLFNGDLRKLQKFILAFGVYIFFLMWITLSRIHGLIEIVNPIQASAGILTTLLVSFFYVLGMYIGVLFFSIMKKRGHFHE